MKKLLLLLVATIHLSAFSQDWMESYGDENILIEYSNFDYTSPSDGIEHTRIIFRYTNRTNEVIDLNFSRKLSYDLQPLEDSPERVIEVNIPANSMVEYDIIKANDKTFYIFSKDKKGTIKKRLTSFEIVNVEIK